MRPGCAWTGRRTRRRHVALLGLGEPVPFTRLRALVEERLLAHRRFRQRIRDPGLGAAEWEDDPRFDLTRHLDQVELSGGAPTLRAHLGELATTPFVPGLPPWRIQHLALGKRSALAVKVHHCVGDGRALVRVLLGLADGAPAAPAQPGPAFRALRFTREPVAATLRTLVSPLAAARLAAEAAAFGTSLARLALLPLDHTELVRPLTGARRLAWMPAVSAAAAIEAAHATGATPNELVVAAIAGGLRQVLGAAGGGDEGEEPRALVPVDARAPGDASLGNAFGLVLLELPTRAGTPGARVAAVRERFARIRRSPDAAVTLAVLAAFGRLPGPLERLGTRFFSRKASLVVTNGRGPPAPVRLAGAEVERMVFWVPHPATLGLGVSILSYAGSLRVGVRADAGLRTDPAALARAIAGELQALGLRVDPRDGRVDPQAGRGGGPRPRWTASPRRRRRLPLCRRSGARQGVP
jgi:diacylglycerol O-acyltransferase